MIDFKKTLINLHEMFPEYDLGKLIEITDAIVEMPNYSYETKKPGLLAETAKLKSLMKISINGSIGNLLE